MVTIMAWFVLLSYQPDDLTLCLKQSELVDAIKSVCKYNTQYYCTSQHGIALRNCI
jgi:hypothetical protein